MTKISLKIGLVLALAAVQDVSAELPLPIADSQHSDKCAHPHMCAICKISANNYCLSPLPGYVLSTAGVPFDEGDALFVPNHCVAGDWLNGDACEPLEVRCADHCEKCDTAGGGSCDHEQCSAPYEYTIYLDNDGNEQFFACKLPCNVPGCKECAAGNPNVCAAGCEDGLVERCFNMKTTGDEDLELPTDAAGTNWARKFCAIPLDSAHCGDDCENGCTYAFDAFDLEETMTISAGSIQHWNAKSGSGYRLETPYLHVKCKDEGSSQTYAWYDPRHWF